jgi:hypothetical protein
MSKAKQVRKEGRNEEHSKVEIVIYVPRLHLVNADSVVARVLFINQVRDDGLHNLLLARQSLLLLLLVCVRELE